MKKIVVLLFALAVATPIFAQGKYGKDSAECIKYLSYYSEPMKQNNLKEAATFWRKAISLCPPTANHNMLINGQKILRYEINLTRNNPQRRAELLDSLIMLHEVRAVTYPKYKVTSLDNKAKDIINFKWQDGDPQKQYNALKEIIAELGPNCSPVVYVKTMQLSVDLYKQQLLAADAVMADYTLTAETIEKVLEKGEKPEFQSAKQDVESILMESGVASCDNLVALYTPRYQAAPEDKDLIASMVKMLSSSNCVDTELFLLSVEALHKLDPSAASAYYLYKLYSSRDKVAEAIESLKNAIALIEGVDTKQAADYSFELATFLFKRAGKSAECVTIAKKALELNPALAGKAYLLIGTVWGSQSCSGNEVESRANFWVALDYMTKARNADESLTEEASTLSAQYRKYFPQQADAFMYDLIDGNSYTVSCNGMREVTTIRTQK